ncbi:MAG: (d)CMP kinase [Betaproteobacteria bacterium]|nr:(d)CMP kinase [Betaproteobacteria bacterium]
MNETIPVIAIDGPTASGKGTVAQEVAQRLGYHYLDSGALYRLVGLAASRKHVSMSDETAIVALAAHLDVRFEGDRITLDGADATDAIRTEEAGQNASRVAALPKVRDTLLRRQKAFRLAPGLVADGRDMGSVVFPDACPKFFLTASVDARAERRVKQLKQKGISAILTDVLKELTARDERDMNRPVAPLQCLPDAYLIDTTEISASQAVEKILSLIDRSR